jgi:hypothetical protein
MRGFCADQAASTTTLAGCTCLRFFSSKYSTPVTRVPSLFVSTRVTVERARTSAPRLRASAR